jgi:preprotein translocase subunit YajC
MNRYMPGMLSAMLILIVPAFLICAGFAFMVYRRWQSPDEKPRG